ncbi:hypothetical protein GYMLUDRAFT_231377 [Collybiopsis luxurians FD-317 M1]|uniref:Cation efflux protein transmembrane domain-containing protein n=1 Tax=Collybiopsis luxurians FD-317 M1 TaxID=944289 RepID=A0A0D0BYP6_9AGAR|nr:hypothetical protein GYMLUDRAFT_231377 [Collybiopsis luxurians FD-317 M1]
MTSTKTQITLHPLASAPPSSPVSNSHSVDTDIERSSSTANSNDSDPYRLRSKIQDAAHIAEMRKRSGGKKQGHVSDFYEQQNEKIEQLLKSIETHAQEGSDEFDANSLKVKIAVRASFLANCILAVLQLYAAISSLSLSFFATAADSVFDPGANFILNWLHKKSKQVDPTKYPVGGARLTTIGNIVYAFAMLTVSVILVAFSIQSLTTHEGGDTLEFHVPSVVAVGVAFVTKFLLFLYCFSIRNASSQVQVLWEDHRNDLFINGLGILTSSAGAKLRWWIDPMGAIIISILIICSWTWTSYVQFDHLAGRAAPVEFNQLVIYKTLTFSKDITQIDSCNAYHSGEKYVVEVDIVMAGDTPLWKTHDTSQDLQDQLETLPMVERAFVHVDYEVSHKPEHRKLV